MIGRRFTPGSSTVEDRSVGARQETPFDPSRAARLDDPARFSYLSVDDVVALIDAPRAATVVDFGAGTGAYTLPLAERRPDLRVIALDVQPAMLALLRRKPAFATIANVQTVERATPELAKTVACVFAVNALHELHDADLASIRELLAPHGRFVAIDWDASIERPVGPPPERVYAPAEAEDRLAGAGLRTIERRSLRYHYALTAVSA
ncbi:MAG: class I SAM-dependent methyltransferase [Candidatus Velthaea sp.]